MDATTKTHAFEDFQVGQVREFGGRVVDKAEGLSFAAYDPQPLHLDEEAANASVLGGLSVSGWHTCAMVMRMMCDAYLLDSTSQGSPGLDNLRWLKPVRPGDTLRVRMTVQETKASKSRPQLGLVRSAWEVFNQRDEAVMTMEGWGMFGRREATTTS
ncbi:MaoC family dehydratase [Paucibacter sp. M5-1]|uniref:MaoC family dehydratase n=1 Tax=Paucibacter sp. M5-1 TaxID=3015998 RepID=UPI0022B92ACA|nr:MaoC family dehydratase [Paucibacter sp. M5-1]MCZ7882061.1 MaoC family dehydratase [Paucibacter sp. M5-1]